MKGKGGGKGKQVAGAATVSVARSLGGAGVAQKRLRESVINPIPDTPADGVKEAKDAKKKALDVAKCCKHLLK